MPTKESVPTFTVIDGGKTELDRKKWLLFNEPWALSLDEFEQVAKLCSLDRAEEFDLMLMRMRHRARSNIEARYLLAVLEGKKAEAERLGKLLERRNALGLRVIETAPSPREEDDPQGQR
ncbi:MAG: hypothetical protein AB1768_19360 [Pseudomonadota bacterium]